MKPQFSTLIILTLVCAVLLVPFALSPIYLDVLRDRSFDLHQFLRGEVYKQGTGYAALVLVFVEMALSLRKRSRSWALWPNKWKIPGAVMLWRMVHIFTGTALLAFVLIHTIGASGNNYNGLLLWTFFGVTLTALIGVVAETGVLESPRKVFSFRRNKALTLLTVAEPPANLLATQSAATQPPTKHVPKPSMYSIQGIGKGTLIRRMRATWLSSHIFLVSVFSGMLVIHIFLVYYYR